MYRPPQQANQASRSVLPQKRFSTFTASAIKPTAAFSSTSLAAAASASLHQKELDAARSVDVDSMSYEQLQQLCEQMGSVRVGVKQNALSRIPTRILTRGAQSSNNKSSKLNEACCICMNDLLEAGEKQSQIKNLPCGHSYHAACIKQWLFSHTSCPVCKADVAKQTASVGDLFSQLMK